MCSFRDPFDFSPVFSPVLAFYDLRHTVFAQEMDYPSKANFLSENPF